MHCAEWTIQFYTTEVPNRFLIVCSFCRLGAPLDRGLALTRLALVPLHVARPLALVGEGRLARLALVPLVREALALQRHVTTKPGGLEVINYATLIDNSNVWWNEKIPLPSAPELKCTCKLKDIG